MNNERQKPVHEIRLGLVRASIWENKTEYGVRHNVTLERLYPVKLVLDVPQPATQAGESGSITQVSPFQIRDVIRVAAIAAAVGLAGYIVYRKVKGKPIQS